MPRQSLPVPAGYLIGSDGASRCILAHYYASGSGEHDLWMVLRSGFRDRYDALVWCNRYITGTTREQMRARKREG